MFRIAADAVAAALARFDEAEAVALFGSVAVPLWREVPRFSDYRRYRIEVWHECKDVDLAVWIGRLERLRELERASARALASLWTERNLGIAHHQVRIELTYPASALPFVAPSRITGVPQRNGMAWRWCREFFQH